VDEDLRLAWQDMLQTLPWDYFLTITFSEPLPVHRAETVMNSVYKTLRAAYSPWTVFLGAEPHVSRLMHLHGLYRSSVGRYSPGGRGAMVIESASDVWRPLFKTFGRSKVEIPRDAAHVSRYVSKYCVKNCEIYNLYTEDYSGAYSIG